MYKNHFFFPLLSFDTLNSKICEFHLGDGYTFYLEVSSALHKEKYLSHMMILDTGCKEVSAGIRNK